MMTAKNNLYSSDFEYFNQKMTQFIEVDVYENIPIDCKELIPIINKYLVSTAKESVSSQAKRIRPMLCYWLMRHYSQSENSLIEILELEKKYKKTLTAINRIAIGIELLHCASLVVDDIEDGSIERRGKESLHVTFGLPIALNTANWMYFLALKQFPQSAKTISIDILFDCHIGQAMDLSSNQEVISKKYFFATEEVRWGLYEKSVALKTGKLLTLPLICLQKALKINASDLRLIKEIFDLYGIIYQIFDDLKNVVPELNSDKLYEDLNSGLRSAVVQSFLDVLDAKEKLVAYEECIKLKFVNFFLEHPKKIMALEKCYYKAAYLLHVNALQLDTIPLSKELRAYLADIIEKPFELIKRNIFSIIQMKYGQPKYEENCI